MNSRPLQTKNPRTGSCDDHLSPKQSCRKKASRCAGCHMIKSLCICAAIPSLKAKTKLCLIAQKSELKKTTNTGRLACASLPNHELIIRGQPGSPIDFAAIAEPDYQLLLLFPTSAAISLDRWISDQNQFHSTCAEPLPSINKPVKLIVAEGNWAQASQISRQVLRHLPCQAVCLNATQPSRYVLRRPPRNIGYLATLESIALAYGILESISIQSQLMQLFDLMLERTLLSRRGITTPPK